MLFTLSKSKIIVGYMAILGIHDAHDAGAGIVEMMLF
jgi:hypothetical protein